MKNGKKLLFFASTSSHIKLFHIEHMKQLKKQGFEIHVACSGAISNEIISKSFDMKIAKRHISLKNIKTIFKLSKLIKSEKYDIISVHTTLAGFLIRKALFLNKEKPVVIYTPHGYLFNCKITLKSLLYIFIEKLLKCKTDILVTMNKEDYELANKYKLSKKILFIHGCGVISDKFQDNKNQINNGDRAEKIFLYPAEFSKRKNHKHLIREFAAAYEKCKDIRLYLAGEGKLFNKMKKLVKKLNLSKIIIFCGFVEDMNLLYSNAYGVISTSKSEGLPYCIMEPLYKGIPIIASDIKGHKDLLEDRKNSLLFSLDEKNSLSNAIILLAGDKMLYKKIKSNCFLKDEYLIENCKKEINDIYKKL